MCFVSPVWVDAAEESNHAQLRPQQHWRNGWLPQVKPQIRGNRYGMLETAEEDCVRIFAVSKNLISEVEKHCWV